MQRANISLTLGKHKIMKKTDAQQLDCVLAMFKPTIWRIQVKPEYNRYCETLEALGYIEIDNHSRDGYFILLTDSGNDFKAKGGFMQLYRNKQVKALKWILMFIVGVLGVLVSFFF